MMPTFALSFAVMPYHRSALKKHYIESPSKLWNKIQKLRPNGSNDEFVPTKNETALSIDTSLQQTDEHNEGFFEIDKPTYSRKRTKSGKSCKNAKRAKDELESTMDTSNNEIESDRDESKNDLNEAFVEGEANSEPISSQYTSSVI